MLIAQALGEYVALSAVVEAFSDWSGRLEDVFGEWGTEGLIVVVAAAIVWRVVTMARR
jgi:hypothetical protein